MLNTSNKLVKATIITIGDELLIGQVIDTNSAFIAQELNKIGINVYKRIAVGDDYESIWNSLNEAQNSSNIVILTGGLGPTADDITKPLLCKYFDGELVLDEPTLHHVTYLFEKVFKKAGPLLERNKKQAEVPNVCTILKNAVGTAPGMLFTKNEVLFFALPGVPHEMKWIVKNHVLPIIGNKFIGNTIIHKTLVTLGVGESDIAEMLIDFEAQLSSHIKLAYLPNYGMVRLRLTATGNDKLLVENEINQQFSSLKQLVAHIMITDKDETLEEIVGNLLLQKKQTVGTAESCTGGYIAHLLTKKSGASNYYEGSVVSYSYAVKEHVLHVSNDILQQKGAVSEETVVQMATEARKLLNTDYAVAVSGIMGPNGGTNDKPVGTVWIAVASISQVKTKLIQLRFDRERNIQLTANAALNLLRELIVDNP
jgi:nicotinamide-nucleotide amidase